MATKEMPLILDNGMSMPLGDVGAVDVGGVDDLFGDGTGLSLRPPSKQLPQRMDKLRNRGCCQTIAWSKAGTIASITADGQELELRYLRCQPSDGEWDLSEPMACSLVKGTPDNPLVHLEWAPTNNPDLAVLDSTGRLSLLIFSTTVNQPFPTKKWDADNVDDMHAVVGCHWLPVATLPNQPYNVMFGPATKVGNGYHYESSFVHSNGPSHPHGSRSALVCVTMGGVLKMHWTQWNNKLEETTIELESISTSDEVVTHAAFASDKKCLLLALVTSSKQLKFVKVEIQWNPQPGATGAQTRFNATLVEKHCAVTSWVGNSVEDGSLPEVSHAYALPSLLDSTGKNTVPPMLLTVRSRPPGSDMDPPALTIIDRWEAVEQRHNLQSAMEQLGNRRNSISSDLSNATNLRRKDPIIINKCILGFQTSHFGKVVILTFSDGSVEYRDRFTFEQLYAERETQSVTSLRQIGWTFTEETPSQAICFSPTYCSMIQITDNGKVKWSKLQCPDVDMEDENTQKAAYAATIAGLTISAATAIKYQANFDDLVAVVRPWTPKKNVIKDWIPELIKLLNVSVDYSVEHTHEALLKNEHLRSCLSIVISFGFKGETRPRSFQSTHALLAVGIRNVAYTITVAISPSFSVSGRKSPLDDHGKFLRSALMLWACHANSPAEVVDMLAHSVRWTLDLIAWLTDSLFELMNDDKFMNLLKPQRFGEIAPYMVERNDVSLQLLTCSSSRNFLTALCRRAAHLETLGKRAMEFYRRQSASGDPNAAAKTSPLLRQAYQRLQQASFEGLVNVGEFEKLVGTLGAGIMQSYENFLPGVVKRQANPPQGKQEDEAIKSARTHLETSLLLMTTPPPGFLQVFNKFFNEDLPAFRQKTDPGKLFFATFDILGVEGTQVTSDGVKVSQIDALSKTKLTMGPWEQWRRCTRCTSVMEEIVGPGAGLLFMVTQQRRCPCSGCWAIMPKGQLAT